MAVLGAFLCAVGVSDLLRASDDDTSTSRRATVAIVGLAVLASMLAATGTSGLSWLTLALPLGILTVAWTLASAQALEARTHLTRSASFAALALGIVLSLLLADGSAATWPDFITGPITATSFDRAILVLGLGLTQLATANVIVRLILEGVGVPPATGERKLKSGRVLGPMERLFILGLGMSGSITAAAAVVAAKGLLRYPEVKAGATTTASDIRPNPLSEYFLIGSFASWLVAVAGLGLAALG